MKNTSRATATAIVLHFMLSSVLADPPAITEIRARYA
ncbi:MAG: hypothetical protein ACI9UA_005449 [Pseudoalteromonas tetraodonis]|jgi:hypothetical protein